MFKFIYLFVGIFVALSARVVMAECVYVPEGPEQATISVCEDEKEYTFFMGGEEHRYDKEEFQARMIGEFEVWLDGTAYEDDDLCGVQVDYWLSIPETNPDATQARVMVTGGSSNFMAFLPLGGDEWVVDDDHMAVLGRGRYPETMGYRPGSLNVKKTEQATFDDLSFHLDQFGLKNLDPIYGHWGAYQLPPFEEKGARDKVLNDADSAIIADIDFNWIFEWIAYKKLAFGFRWACE